MERRGFLAAIPFVAALPFVEKVASESFTGSSPVFHEKDSDETSRREESTCRMEMRFRGDKYTSMAHVSDELLQDAECAEVVADNLRDALMYEIKNNA